MTSFKMSNIESCTSIFEHEMKYYSLIPSVLVLCILHGLEYNKHKRINFQAPFLSLRDNDKNRKMVVFGFGSLSSSMISFIFTSQPPSKDDKMETIIENIGKVVLNVLVAGLINYPTFACISSGQRYIGSLLGSLFTFWRLMAVILTGILVDCTKGDSKGVTITVNLIGDLPSIVCCSVLLAYFIRRCYKCAKRQPSHHGLVICNNADNKMLNLEFARKQQMRYVWELFRKTNFNVNVIVGVPWYTRPVNALKKIFQSNFQYSTLFASSIAMILIAYYYLGVFSIYFYTTYFASLNGHVFFDCCFGISFVITACTYTVITLHFLYCHQRTMLSLYQGKKEQIRKVSTKTLIQYNILFPGYLVAYMTWGIIVFFFVFVGLFALVYLFVQGLINSPDFKRFVLAFLKYLFSVLFLPVVIYLGQKLLVYFIFTKRKQKVDTMINHIKLYHIVIYFNFFYNIVIGVSSSLKRSFVSLFISLLFMGRIDRTSYVFFSTLDNGYQAYLGFLYVQKIYKNPIMRCFCQLLFNDVCRDSTQALSEMTHSVNYHHQHHQPQYSKGVAKISRRAYNRWFLAVTLLNNPSLVKVRGGNNKNGIRNDEPVGNNEIVGINADPFSYSHI